MKNIFVVILIAIAGFYFLSGKTTANDSYKNISTNEAKQLYQQPGYILLDVRTPAEISERSIAGSLNIPLQEIEQRLSEIPQDKKLLVICRSGNRSRQAIQILSKHGYKELYNVDGGISSWK